MQVSAAAFVADPPGDANVQVEVQVVEQRALFTGKTMHHRGRQAVSEIADYFQQALAGVALMEEDRQLQFNGQGQVLLQHFFLLRARGEVPIEVQATFAHGFDAAFLEQAAQALGTVGIPVAGAMRMNTGGREQLAAAFVQLPRQLERLFAAFDAGAGEHQLADTGGIGSVQYCAMFFGETRVGQVDADIDELHGAISACGRKAYQSCRFIRKAKNYNELELSLDAGRKAAVGLPAEVVPVFRILSAL
ncbi:hypothetical protein EMIT0324P_30133 [Pseudomonas chlororaphis]